MRVVEHVCVYGVWCMCVAGQHPQHLHGARAPSAAWPWLRAVLARSSTWRRLVSVCSSLSSVRPEPRVSAQVPHVSARHTRTLHIATFHLTPYTQGRILRANFYCFLPGYSGGTRRKPVAPSAPPLAQTQTHRTCLRQRQLASYRRKVVLDLSSESPH